MHPPCPPVGRICRTYFQPLPPSQEEDTGTRGLTTLGARPAKLTALAMPLMGSPISAITADGGAIGSFSRLCMRTLGAQVRHK
jgi:hypothetical protein